MEQHRWSWLPIGLASAGVAAVCAATIVNHAVLGWWQALDLRRLCIAAVAAAASFAAS